MTAGEKFLALSNDAKVKSLIDSGVDTLAAAASTNKELFEIHKALSLASATASLPDAVIKSYENAGGYPWGVIPAALMAAAGAAEIASIASSSYSQAHSGIDNVPSDSTFLLKKGEMVLDPGTSEEVRQAATGGGTGSGVSFGDIIIQTVLSEDNQKTYVGDIIIPELEDAMRDGALTI